MRRLAWTAVLLAAGCASAVPLPTEREAETARRTDPTATVESLRSGRERYVTKCSGCHSLYSPRDKSPEEWPRLLDEMSAKAKCGAGDRRRIEQYLLAIARTPETNR